MAFSASCTEKDSWCGQLSLRVAFFLFYWLTEPAVTDNLSDNQWYIPTSFSILKDGDLDLSEYQVYGLTAEDYRIFEDNEKLYNFFAAGPALVAVPLALLGKRLYSPSAHQWTFRFKSVL